MATEDINGLSRVISAGLFRPDLEDRFTNADVTPKHFLCGVIFDGFERILNIHTAGTGVIWRTTAPEAARNIRLIKGMAPEDALSIGFYAASSRQAS